MLTHRERIWEQNNPSHSSHPFCRPPLSYLSKVQMVHDNIAINNDTRAMGVAPIARAPNPYLVACELCISKLQHLNASLENM